MAPPLPKTRRRRRVLAALPPALIVPLVLAPSAFASLKVLPMSGGSPNANGIRTLYILIAILGLIIFVAVEGLLVYSMVKFRARRGATAAQIHGNTQLEIGWTVGAAVILVFITVFTFIKLGAIKDPAASDITSNGTPVAQVGGSSSDNLYAATDQPPPPAGSAQMHITVNGQQYIWKYDYPGPQKVFSYVDMVVPVGMTVTLDVTSVDVAHSWWIPALGGKADAIPGYVNHTWFKIPLSALKPGQKQVVYHGQCAELCGRNHANMYGNVIGMRYADWKRWYDEKAREIKQAEQQAAVERKQREGSGSASSGAAQTAGAAGFGNSSNP